MDFDAHLDLIVLSFVLRVSELKQLSRFGLEGGAPVVLLTADLDPVVDLLEHFVDTGGVFVDEHRITCLRHLLEHKVKVSHELGFGQQFDPLNENVDKASLKQNGIPLIVFDHFKHVAHIISLIQRCFIIFLNFAKHTNYRQQCVFL